MPSIEAIEASQMGLCALAAALAIGLTALGTAWAEGGIGRRILEELPKSKTGYGKFLVMAAIPESIIIFGFGVAVLIWML